MASWREQVQEYLDNYMKTNPPIIGGGRRTIIMPEPRPEDKRPKYNATGDVPEGFVRAEIVRPNYDQNDPNSRKGSFWVNVRHQDNPNAVLERVFNGDIVDIPDAQFEKLYAKNWVREPREAQQPWIKKDKKPQAA